MIFFVIYIGVYMAHLVCKYTLGGATPLYKQIPVMNEE